MTARIPAELIFHIISFLQDNKAALSACSLCCSALATVSRPLLFRTLRTGLCSEAADRFECLLESSPDVSALIKRIDVAISILEPLVDQRTIVAISQIMTSHPIQDTPPTLGIVIQYVVGSHHRFGQLLLSYLDPVVHWVTSLELGQLNFIEDIPFWDLVLAFPKLKSLILGCVNVEERVHILSHRKSEISHITLKGPALGARSNIRWFLSDHPLPLPSLTSLDVRLPPVLDRAPVRFGEVYGLTVRTLRFGALTDSHPPTSWSCGARKFLAINLVLHTTLIPPVKVIAGFISQFSNLEALTFQGLFAPRVPVLQPTPAFEWITTALSAVSPTVRKLTMEVIAGHLSYLDIIPWSDIDERLAHQLQSVITVEILFATPVGANYLLENVRQEMEKRLPLAAQRGVLRCSAVAELPI
jgi:hypothetical protein